MNQRTKRIGGVLMIIIGASLILHFILYFTPYRDLDKALTRPYSLGIYDRNGLLLYTLPLDAGKRREYRAFTNIPRFVKKVFIRTEDKRFYYHPGVDPLAMLRTLYINLTRGKIKTGASTITMQLARIISPHKGGYTGKIREIINALRLEAKLSKKEIFELWINSIPYGFNTEGVASAGPAFFGKSLDALTIEQIIALSIIPRNPSLYNPLTSPEPLIEKITLYASWYDLDIDRIRQSVNEAKHYEWKNEFPHFVQYVAGMLTDADKIAGKRIITSLDLDFNRMLNGRLNQYLHDYIEHRITNGAVLAVDNHTGEIVAYIGSRDFYNTEYSGQIDGIHVLNQPGSTLKPFLFALALEKGFLPSTIVPDIPMDFGHEDVYIPMNFNRRFNGPVRMREALASSLNIPAVYLITRVGVRNFIDTLITLGFNSLTGHEDRLGSGVALGNCEVSLFELTRAFSIFARLGKSNKLTCFKTGNGDTNQGTQLMTPYTAFIISDILRDSKSRVRGFGMSNVLNAPFPLIIKTGTSNQFNNIWAVGSTPDYTVGVWLGNFSGETVIGRTGSSIPARLVIEALSALTDQDTIQQFTGIEGIKQADICSLSGKMVQAWCPGTMDEYFREETVIENCDYHVQENEMVVVRYPPEFSSWANTFEQKGSRLLADDADAYPQIIKPNTNAVYYYNPSIDAHAQQITIETAHNDEHEVLDVFINGQYTKSITYPYDIAFPIRPGEWVVEVRGKQHSDSVTIRVN